MKLIGILSILCALLSCTLEGEQANKRIQRPIFIVIVSPLSGPLAEFGESMLRGGKMRIAQIKDKNSFNDRPVKLMALDDKGKPEEALRLAGNITHNDSIYGVIGHLTTGCALSVIPVYNAAKMAFISPVATGDDLQDVKSPYAFRTILSESRQAMSLADYIHQNIGAKEVVLIWESSSLGNRLKQAFSSRGNEVGLHVHAVGVESDPFPDLSEAVRQAVKIRPGAIFLAGGPRLAAMIAGKWPENIERPLMFGVYRLVSDEFAELAGKKGKGILAAHPCVWKSDFKKGTQMKAEYEKTFKHHTDWLAVQTFDAVDLLLWAVGKSGGNPRSISNVLHKCRSKNSSFPGLAGPIYFDADGSLARGVNVAEYTDGGWKFREN
jgi:branched-chain amino acid transport system substrate-binding protein